MSSPTPACAKLPLGKLKKGSQMKMTDAIVIGGGIVGVAIAPFFI